MANDQDATVNVTINGTVVSVPPDTRIIEAAELAGVGIAHYCYHPGLSAPAMCRMCLVEVEGVGKLQPACVTLVAEGQVVNTESPRSLEAREGTLEFYMTNHPLDCPVCDKSGECKLQDYVHAEGPKRGRSIEAKRVNGQDDFGGDIIYDGDRCIMCTRCVRFMRELPQDDRLGVIQRGHRSVIDTFFDHGVEGNIWAGNIVDICPVGALLSKDFLHKARVWDLDNTSSICPNCSQGCNIKIDTRDNLVMRLRPRTNPDVNSYWMCDYGRHRYEWLNMADRIEAPLVRNADGRLLASSWQDAMLNLVNRIGAERSHEAVAVGSAFMSNESNGLLARLLSVLGGTTPLFRSERAADEIVMPGFPHLARRRDLAANVRGLEALGFQRVGDDEGTGGLPVTKDRVVIIMGDELIDAPADYGSDASLFIVLGHVATPAARNAHFMLPVSSFAEEEGTFTSFDGRVQRFWPALQAPPLARPAWQVLGVLLAGLDEGNAPANAGSAFIQLGERFDSFQGLTYEIIGPRGALLNEPVRLAGATAGGR
ncbi:MAG: molybdopterin-dependent oxidoreductase [Longimicrobiales bacterium]